MRKLLWATLLTVSARAELNSIQVWARVATSVITDRAILVEAVLENPSLWKGSASSISMEDQNQSFQRLIVQAMTNEENRIFRAENIAADEITQDVRNLEKTLGTQYKAFLGYFDLNDVGLRDRISSRILLEKSLRTRVKNYAQNLSSKDQERVIEDWVSQLRGRYRVQNFRLDRNNPRLKLISEEDPS